MNKCNRCYKCKNIFSSSQALHYHVLKKKIKCDSEICCIRCTISFRTKTDYNFHLKYCKSGYVLYN